MPENVARLTSVPRKNPAAASRTVDGQAVIAISEQAAIHILNDVGTRVWNLIDGRRRVEEIVASVAGQLTSEGYESVPDDLAGDVEAFLDEIGSKGMLSTDGETE